MARKPNNTPEMLLAQKEAHRRARYQKNLFDGKLLPKQKPLVNGYSGPVGTNG